MFGTNSRHSKGGSRRGQKYSQLPTHAADSNRMNKTYNRNPYDSESSDSDEEEDFIQSQIKSQQVSITGKHNTQRYCFFRSAI